MTTDLRQLPAYLSNDADFRTWGQGICAQLTAIGLVKTSDTGQINWATAIKPNPGGASTTYGAGYYEIWRLTMYFRPPSRSSSSLNLELSVARVRVLPYELE